ncbi:hypothetical protein C4901_09065 [Acidiferrobacter sp. SPIII_3]|nr:hypothetical protein C4901_09065 [Acidiferrobacter sp. SPIII_3]
MARKSMFRNEDDARQVARCFCSDPVAAAAIGVRMFQADAMGENSCFLHQSALYYHTDCLCSVCAPGAARGLFAGVVVRHQP